MKKLMKDHIAKLQADIVDDFRNKIQSELEGIFEEEVIPFCQQVIVESLSNIDSGKQGS